MVIDNFYIVRILPYPVETNSPLPINSDTVLAFPISLKEFEMIGRRIQKAFKLVCHMEIP